MPPATRHRILIPWLACILFLALWDLSNTTLHRDLSLFLPDTATADEQLLLTQFREGIAARTILIALRGDATAAELAAASQALARHLRQTGFFQRVANGSSALDEDSLAPVLEHRYLIGPTGPCVDALTPAGVRQALETRLAELAGPLPPLDKHRIGADPSGCFRDLLLDWLPPIRPRQSKGVWVSRDGAEALLIARTQAPASDLPAQVEAVAAIRDGFATLAQTADLGLAMTGPAFFAVGSQEAIRAQTAWLSITASLLVALLLLAAFRSPTLVLIGALPLITGLLVGIAVVVQLFGSLHGITLALGITLLGVAMDYPVHLFAHAERRGGVTRGLTGIGPTLSLAVATTALGYGALALAEFEGLAQLGVLSATGLATAALCTRFALPGLLPNHHGWRATSGSTRWAAGPPTLGRRGRLLLALAVGALLLGTLAAKPSPWTADLSRLSTVPRHEIALDQRLRSELGAPDVARLLFVTAESPEAVLARTEPALDDLRGLVDSGLIGGFEAAARLLPSARTQMARQARLPSRSMLAERLSTASTALPFRPGAFTAFLDQVEQSRGLSPLRPSDLSQTPLGDRIGSLLLPIDGGWVGLIRLMGADHPPTAAALRALAATKGLSYLDLRETSANLIARFIDETLNSLILTAALICAILVLAIRRPGRLARVLPPIALTLALNFALLLMLEGALNLFHLVAMLLVLGLSIDYSLFLSRPHASPLESARTLFAVWISALSSFAMFALLSLSSIPVLHAIGLTVALGIALAFPLSLLLSPETGRASDKPS